MLIRQAELPGMGFRDLRIAKGRVAALAATLPSLPGETVLEAQGGLLLPGLRDHHIHLYAAAAAATSVHCGPPEVADAGALRCRLAAAPGQGWLRGVAYHPTVAGDIDRDWLDAAVPHRPVRIQHRGGRLWILNSLGLEALGEIADDDPPERRNGRLSGRIYDADDWLRQRLGGQRPNLRELSRELAGYGITAVTDTSPRNDRADRLALLDAQACGDLLQDVQLMGGPDLDGAESVPGLCIGPRKFHLLESNLPDFDTLCLDIQQAHAAGRCVAFHCVSRTELVFALAALQAAGARAGDRIEHAGVAPPEQLAKVAELGLIVVTQPIFVLERGDVYLREVAEQDQAWLYRLRSWLDAAVPLAGSSDAPYGDLNPWRAMQSATNRMTAQGVLLGVEEALTAEQALALYLSPLKAPGAAATDIQVGMNADLCLLDSDWPRAREDLAQMRVRATWKAGVQIAGANPAQLC